MGHRNRLGGAPLEARAAEIDRGGVKHDDLAGPHERVVRALAGGGPVTPDGLQARIDALVRRRTRARRRSLGVALAAAAALALVVVLVAGREGSDVPGAVEASRVVTRPAAAPAPAVDSRQPDRLGREFQGVKFPNWAKEFGWVATGARRDRVAGRSADTVFYVHDGHRIAYTVLAGEPLPAPDGARRLTVNGVELHRFSDGDRDAVVFERGGRTCVLAGDVHDPATLVKLASWKGGGALRFT
jgi:hypothetical protein